MQRVTGKRGLLLVVAYHCLAVSGSGGQDPAERLFQAGLSDFRAGRYASAAAGFGTLADASPRHRRATAALVMAAKSEYRAGRYDRAKGRAEALVERHPRSAYGDDARYLIALSDYRLGRYDIAASDLLDMMKSHPVSPLVPRADELFRHIVSTRLPPSELKRLADTDLPAGLDLAVGMARARAYIRQGNDTLALALLDGLRGLPGTPVSLAEVNEMREEVVAGGSLQIAALLPILTGNADSDVGRIGQEVLDGIEIAAAIFNAETPRQRPVEVLPKDTGRDTALAAAQVRELSLLSRVRAIIGPLFSDVFAAASVAANESHLPIISPTATADRIAAVGPFVFQANPDYSTRGRAAARFAVRDLRMSSFAVLASDDPVGRAHARGFVEEAGLLGGTVHSTVYFPPEASDLREEFLSLRRAVMADRTTVLRAELLKPELAPALAAFGVDSLPPGIDSVSPDLISVTALFGSRGFVVAESLGLPIASFDTTADETDIPLVSLDGIFLALGDPGQIDYVAPQFDYFNIRAQIIGNNEWYDPARLRDNRESVEGALFVSDSHIDQADSATAAFSRLFSERTSRRPTKFTLYGYDTMNLILAQLRAGARTRNDIARGLSGVEGYRGIHSEITLRGGRVNRFLHIMKYAGGSIRRLGSVTVEGP